MNINPLVTPASSKEYHYRLEHVLLIGGHDGEPVAIPSFGSDVKTPLILVEMDSDEDTAAVVKRLIRAAWHLIPWAGTSSESQDDSNTSVLPSQLGLILTNTDGFNSYYLTPNLTLGETANLATKEWTLLFIGHDGEPLREPIKCQGLRGVLDV